MAYYKFQVPIELQDHAQDYNETKRLIELSQKGCNVSRQKIIEQNLKLVINIVHRFKGKEEIFEDLFQIGTIGLMKSIDNFDLSRDVKFSTYAVPMIIGEIKRHLRDNNTIKLSRSIQDNARKIKVFCEQFLIENQREATVSEICKNIDMEEEDVIMAICSMGEIVSLNKPISESNDEKNISFEERIASSDNLIESWFDKQTLKEAFQILNEKEKEIITMRFYQDKTQSEVGEQLGISQAHVSRIEKVALGKLKEVI